MAWKVEYMPQEAVVALTASGSIRNEDARAQATEAFRLLNENETVGLLVDHSDALSELTLPELYWLANDAFALGAPWRLRMAVLLPRTRYRSETYEFLELVFRNAGYEVRLFKRADAAADWLAALPPARKQAEPCPQMATAAAA